MKSLRSPEQIKASKLEATSKYLEHAEEALSELLGPLFGEDRLQVTDEFMATFTPRAMDVRALVMALRRFPRFDVACLSALKPFKFKRRITGGGPSGRDVEIDVVVPTFAVVDLNCNMGFAEFDLLNERNAFYLGGDSNQEIRFNFDLQMQNRTKVENLRMNWQDGKLRAKVPDVPVDVRKRIDEARPIFSRMSLVWEAEWEPAPLRDPLILGHVLGHTFLVDQYDVTKLERYISSEMTRSPLK
jgi:hypothetical protein